MLKESASRLAKPHSPDLVAPSAGGTPAGALRRVEWQNAAVQLCRCTARTVQARIDMLDEGRRFVDPDFHDWGDPEEGGAGKATRVIQS